MKLDQNQIAELDRTYRLNLINSITGIKPGNLIGSIDADGNENLAIISSVVHLGSNPPYIGFIIRPYKEFRRDTYNNISQTKCFTINHIPEHLRKNAHYTSAKLAEDISEFERCNIPSEYIGEFKAPFVKDSPIKIGLKHIDSIDIKLNGTCMVIGEVVTLSLNDDIINDKAYIDLDKAKVVGIGGLNSYYSLKYLDSFPYVRTNEVPDFE